MVQMDYFRLFAAVIENEINIYKRQIRKLKQQGRLNGTDKKDLRDTHKYLFDNRYLYSYLARWGMRDAIYKIREEAGREGVCYDYPNIQKEVIYENGSDCQDLLRYHQGPIYDSGRTVVNRCRGGKKPDRLTSDSDREARGEVGTDT